MANSYDIGDLELSPEIASKELPKKLMDATFNAKDNAWIKRMRKELYKVVELIKTDQQMAEVTLRMLYDKSGYHPHTNEYDNYFCYSLADKLRIEAGLKPIIEYETEEV